GSICARLGPNSSSASVRSLWRISAPFTLASTGLASSARSGRLANKAIASTPVAAAKRTCAPRFASDDEVVMENPYLQSRMAVAAGPFKTARHSPNRVALATRKVCQNDEFPERRAMGVGPRQSPANASIGPFAATVVNADCAPLLKQSENRG